MSAVDAAALVELTQQLVRIPSVHDPARGLCEQPAAELVADRRCGRSAGRRSSTTSQPGRPNVIAVVEGGGGPGPTLMFEGHTDVVTEGDGLDRRPVRRRDRRRPAVRAGARPT